ncbi:MAG TPA: hypothetical protein VER14_06925 [Phototrophicaceae bacterium]|nr:hypothetical protein [Phototrophicaceae bacterium]
MSDQNENTINKQNSAPGQEKEVDVKDYPYASEYHWLSTTIKISVWFHKIYKRYG